MKIPAQSPNCNSCAEGFVKTIKYECLNRSMRRFRRNNQFEPYEELETVGLSELISICAYGHVAFLGITFTTS